MCSLPTALIGDTSVTIFFNISAHLGISYHTYLSSSNEDFLTVANSPAHLKIEENECINIG